MVYDDLRLRAMIQFLIQINFTPASSLFDTVAWLKIRAQVFFIFLIKISSAGLVVTAEHRTIGVTKQLQRATYT